MSNIGFLCVVLVLGAYNFTLPRVKKSTHIEPRNEKLNGKSRFITGNKYSPRFNKK